MDSKINKFIGFFIFILIVYQVYSQFNNINETFNENYHGYKCPDCDELNENECIQCSNCGWFVSDGVGKCIDDEDDWKRDDRYNHIYYDYYLTDPYWYRNVGSNSYWFYNKPYYSPIHRSNWGGHRRRRSGGGNRGIRGGAGKRSKRY